VEDARAVSFRCCKMGPVGLFLFGGGWIFFFLDERKQRLQSPRQQKIVSDRGGGMRDPTGRPVRLGRKRGGGMRDPTGGPVGLGQKQGGGVPPRPASTPPVTIPQAKKSTYPPLYSTAPPAPLYNI